MGTDLVGGGAEPVALLGEHLRNLAASGNHGAEFAGGVVGQRAGLRGSGFGKAGEGASIEGVRLGQLAHGSGEVSHLSGVDYGHGHVGSRQLVCQGEFQSSGGLHHHQLRGQLAETLREGRYGWELVGVLPRLSRGTYEHVQPFGGHVYAYEQLVRFHIFSSLDTIVACSDPALHDSDSKGPFNCSGSGLAGRDGQAELRYLIPRVIRPVTSSLTKIQG